MFLWSSIAFWVLMSELSTFYNMGLFKFLQIITITFCLYTFYTLHFQLASVFSLATHIYCHVKQQENFWNKLCSFLLNFPWPENSVWFISTHNYYAFIFQVSYDIHNFSTLVATRKKVHCLNFLKGPLLWTSLWIPWFFVLFRAILVIYFLPSFLLIFLFFQPLVLLNSSFFSRW